MDSLISLALIFAATVNAQTSTEVIWLSETFHPDTTVVELSSGLIKYDLRPAKVAVLEELFRFDSTFNKIKLNKQIRIDYILKVFPSFEGEIEMDLITETRNFTKKLRIVREMGKSPPRFDNDIDMTFAEKSCPGTKLASLRSFMWGVAENEQLTFAIAPVTDPLYPMRRVLDYIEIIDVKEGWLQIKKFMDFELLQLDVNETNITFGLNVFVKDAYGMVQSKNCKIYVTHENISTTMHFIYNNTRRVYIYQGLIPETAPSNVSLKPGSIAASPDSPWEGQRIRYSILMMNPEESIVEDYFTIDPETGELNLVKLIPADLVEFVHLTILATEVTSDYNATVSVFLTWPPARPKPPIRMMENIKNNRAVGTSVAICIAILAIVATTSVGVAYAWSSPHDYELFALESTIKTRSFKRAHCGAV